LEISPVHQAEKRFETTPQNPVISLDVTKPRKSRKPFSCLTEKGKKKRLRDCLDLNTEELEYLMPRNEDDWIFLLKTDGKRTIRFVCTILHSCSGSRSRKEHDLASTLLSALA
jgi:hypothetical protein